MPQTKVARRAADFVRACAVKMHMGMAQEPISSGHFMTFTGKNSSEQIEHPDQAPALAPTVRTLSVDTLFGKGSQKTSHNW